MVRSAAVFAAVFFVGLARDPGCGADDKPSGVNGPCTRSKDCNAGLECSEGVCTQPDGGETGDASRDGS
jgi:hypothetical protein